MDERKTGSLDIGPAMGGGIWLALAGWLIELDRRQAQALAVKILQCTGVHGNFQTAAPVPNLIETRQ
jgi:hypothetical protein